MESRIHRFVRAPMDGSKGTEEKVTCKADEPQTTQEDATDETENPFSVVSRIISRLQCKHQKDQKVAEDHMLV